MTKLKGADHPNYDTINKLIPGKFKDEMAGTVIIEFVDCIIVWVVQHKLQKNYKILNA